MNAIRERLDAAGLIDAARFYEGPDAALLMLAARFVEGTRDLQDFNASDHEMGTGAPEDIAFEQTNDNWWTTLWDAVAIPATTPAGLRAKAEIVRWAMVMDRGDCHGKANEADAPDRLAVSLAEDLMRLAGAMAPFSPT